MKLTLKNLQQQTFTLDIDPDISVKQLKEKIEAEKGSESYAVDCQKLIYAGKIMTDEDKISKYNIDEKKFVVVMVTKTKPASASAAPTTAAPAAASASKAESDKKTPDEKPPASPMDASSSAPSGGESGESKDEKKSEEVDDLMARIEAEQPPDYQNGGGDEDDGHNPPIPGLEQSPQPPEYPVAVGVEAQQQLAPPPPPPVPCSVLVAVVVGIALGSVVTSIAGRRPTLQQRSLLG